MASLAQPPFERPRTQCTATNRPLRYVRCKADDEIRLRHTLPDSSEPRRRSGARAGRARAPPPRGARPFAAHTVPLSSTAVPRQLRGGCAHAPFCRALTPDGSSQFHGGSTTVTRRLRARARLAVHVVLLAEERVRPCRAAAGVVVVVDRQAGEERDLVDDPLALSS